MMQDDFIAASAHIDELDPAAEAFPIVRETLLSINLMLSCPIALVLAAQMPASRFKKI